MSNYYSDDNEPTQYAQSYGEYGAQPMPPAPEPIPWYRKPAALLGLGALGAIIVALVVYAIVQLFSSGGDTKPAGVTTTSSTTPSVTPTATTTPAREAPGVAPPATQTVTETEAPDAPTTTDTETTTATTTTEEPATTTTTTEPSVTVSTSTTVVTNTVTIPEFPRRQGN